MSKYHINPETGNAGPCSAKISCPFGDLEKDHYETKEAAVEAYETAMAGAGWQPAEKIESFKSLNEGELQEIHLGFRTLLNDLKDLKVDTIQLAGRTFTRRGGHLYEGSHRINVTKRDLENFAEIMHDGDKLATTLAATDLAKKFGFDSLPKAPSQEKVDITFTTQDGAIIKGSVKAFTGAPPSLMSASRTTAVVFEKELNPQELALAKKILAEKEKNIKTKIIPKLAQTIGFHLDYEHARLESDVFKETLTATAGKEGPDAMLKALISKRDPNTEVPNDETWHKIVAGLATRAVPTKMLEEDKQANAMIDINKDGSIDVVYSESQQELGKHLAPKIFIERAGKPKSEFSLEGNKLVVRTFASLRISGTKKTS